MIKIIFIVWYPVDICNPDCGFRLFAPRCDGPSSSSHIVVVVQWKWRRTTSRAEDRDQDISAAKNGEFGRLPPQRRRWPGSWRLLSGPPVTCGSSTAWRQAAAAVLTTTLQRFVCLFVCCWCAHDVILIVGSKTYLLRPRFVRRSVGWSVCLS